MIPALRWAAMRAILMFQWEVINGQSHKTVSTNHNHFEKKGEPKRYRTEVPQLSSLTLYLLILSFIALHSPPAGVGCDQFLPSEFIQLHFFPNPLSILPAAGYCERRI